MLICYRSNGAQLSSLQLVHVSQVTNTILVNLQMVVNLLGLPVLA